MKTLVFSFGLAVLVTGTVTAAESVQVGPLLEKLRQVGPHAKGHPEAAAAWKQLAQADVAQVPQILAGMQAANVLAVNWIRSAVDAICERQLRADGKLPVEGLEKFISDRQQAPRARRVAYEWLVKADATAKSRLLAGFLDDPSLELRYDAVADAMQGADGLAKGNDKPAAVAAYRAVLSAARDIEQIKRIAEKLKEQGEQADLPAHFGFVMQWKIVGPFDNSNMGGFGVAYPPENQLQAAGKYEGKTGEVNWKDFTTTDSFGVVDLTKALDKHKGAVAYALAAFVASEDCEVEVRLGSPNANKVWVNGELITANEVYHSGNGIDQYVGQAQLKQGSNAILVKICQNEQTEDWAQDWQFQLRVCDEFGTAVLARNRPATQTAARSWTTVPLIR